jgi:exonuclease V gamma subunit
VSEQKLYTAAEIAEVMGEAKRIIKLDAPHEQASGKRFTTRVSLVGIVEQLQSTIERLKSALSPEEYLKFIREETP